MFGWVTGNIIQNWNEISYFLARRRAAAKRKKLKNLGKSKSTDTEEEEADDDCADDGKYIYSLLKIVTIFSHFVFTFPSESNFSIFVLVFGIFFFFNHIIQLAVQESILIKISTTWRLV